MPETQGNMRTAATQAPEPSPTPYLPPSSAWTPLLLLQKLGQSVIWALRGCGQDCQSAVGVWAGVFLCLLSSLARPVKGPLLCASVPGLLSHLLAAGTNTSHFQSWALFNPSS